MDLSSIPTEVLQAEHLEVSLIPSAAGWVRDRQMCHYFGHCRYCPLSEGECAGLRDSYDGWSERKEHYLLAIRAELAERSRLSQPSKEVQAI